MDHDRVVHLEDLPDALTESEVLSVLPLSRPTLRKLRENGTIHAVHAGRRVLYPRASIASYLGLSA
jgi:excisionase family DNA binding protein